MPDTETHAPTLVDYATYAMSQGWDPIPVFGVNAQGACSCKNGLQCKSPGKHPVETNWAGAGRTTKKALWEHFGVPAHPLNVGLRTGKISGFWALDIDPKSGGDESLLSLESQHEALPETRVHRTGSGGKHYLFRLPTDFEITNSRGRLPRGIDVRGNGGFIVAPGSVTGVGTYRTESGADIATAPEWLLDLIRPQTLDRQIEVVDSVPYDSLAPDAQQRAQVYLASAVAGEVRRLDAMKAAASDDMSSYDGEPWNHTTYEVCCNLLELAQSQWLPFGIEEIKKILVEHAPTDSGFTGADVMGRLVSAASKVRGKDRPMPASMSGDSWDFLTSDVGKFLPKAPDGETVTDWPEEPWNQVGNARRTIRMANGRLVWVPERSTWYECNLDHVWSRPPIAARDDVAAKWCARAMEAAVNLEAMNYSAEPGVKKTARGETEDASQIEKFQKFMEESSKVEMHTAVATQLRRRAQDFGLEVPVARFDAGDFDFACANGLIDLRTGEIRALSQDDHISIASPVRYDPEMPIPHFMRFLETSHPDPEMRSYLQKVLGYSMTNSIDGQVMFIHHGAKTANGKSVLMDALKAILGGHMSPASEKTLIKQRGTSAQRIGQDMVDLIGYRFLTLNETEEGGTLDSATAKSLTSGDLRADRGHAQANQQYRITGKIHVITNHLPHITPDPAMKRRIVVIPWTESFVDNPDPNLGRKLAGELPGILAWLVQGAARWYADFQAHGVRALEAPARSRAELETFFEEEDEVGSWIKDCGIVLDPESDPKTWATAKSVHDDYLIWRGSQGLNGQPLSPSMLGRRLTPKGIEGKTVRLGETTSKVRRMRLLRSQANTIDEMFGKVPTV